MDIKNLRKEIDAIDQELVTLFCKRMEVAARIADYKKEHGLPIYHPGREQEILECVTKLSGHELSDYTKALYSEIFQLSKQYQNTRKNQI